MVLVPSRQESEVFASFGLAAGLDAQGLVDGSDRA
jgi:hypothetical protein